MEGNELSALAEQFAKAGSLYGGKINAVSIMNDAAAGKMTLSPGAVLAFIFTELLSALTNNIQIVLIIAGIAFLSAFAVNLCHYENPVWNDIINFAIAAVLAAPLAGYFNDAVRTAENTMNDMEAMMLSSLPLLAALGLSSGSGIFVLLAQGIALLIRYVFTPLAVFYGGLGFCEALTDRFSLKEIRSTVKSVLMWGMGITMTSFSCASVMSGAVLGSFTGLRSRSLKYIGSMVPVVGAYLSESADMVFSSANAIKNAGGVGAIAAVAIVAAAPSIRLLAFSILIKFSSIIIQPVAGGKICAVVSSVAEALSILLGLTALMGAFFIINIAVFTAIKLA